jgi:hypothetical protein
MSDFNWTVLIYCDDGSYVTRFGFGAENMALVIERFSEGQLTFWFEV